MTYYAHSTKKTDKSDWQLLKDHSLKVAELSSEFAKKFNSPDTGYLVGIIHDIGKYSIEGQNIFGNPTLKVDHSTAGARELVNKYPNMLGRMLAYTSAGHHSGLPNGGSGASLIGRIDKKEIPDYSQYSKELNIPITNILSEMTKPISKTNYGFSFSFYIRMLFSCLVDADSLDTEKFYSKKRSGVRQNKPNIEDLNKLYNETIAELQMKNRLSPSKVNVIRSHVLETCIKMASHIPGFFSLTGPTGVGKTYSCMAFALKHAKEHKKSKVIYAIHYTSVGEQNADVFRKALGSNAVLEHHSTFEYPKDDFDSWGDDMKRNLLSSENWDMPIIITTTLQFFESLFSNKRTRCRKLHNYTNSVIILDEAQLMQIEFLEPCIWALTELVSNYGCTVIFCSATQPDFSKLLPIKLPITEIIENPKKLNLEMNRVTVKYSGYLSDKQLANDIYSKEQSLTVVNTRKHAFLLYSCLKEHSKDVENDGIFLLYNRMCSINKKDILKKIKARLVLKLPCRVVSTSLIEVGVDVDFPYVYRSITGVDSLVQVAGRCNREGILDKGIFVIFTPEKHGMPSVGRFSECADISLSLIKKYGSEVLSIASTREYFDTLYKYERKALDDKDILGLISESQGEFIFPFKDISNKFSMIEDTTVSIVIKYDLDAEKYLDELNETIKKEEPIYKTLRKLQSYTIQIYKYEFDELIKRRKLSSLGEDIVFYLNDSSLYTEAVGLIDIGNQQSLKNKVYTY